MTCSGSWSKENFLHNLKAGIYNIRKNLTLATHMKAYISLHQWLNFTPFSFLSCSHSFTPNSLFPRVKWSSGCHRRNFNKSARSYQRCHEPTRLAQCAWTPGGLKSEYFRPDQRQCCSLEPQVRLRMQGVKWLWEINYIFGGQGKWGCK